MLCATKVMPGCNEDRGNIHAMFYCHVLPQKSIPIEFPLLESDDVSRTSTYLRGCVSICLLLVWYFVDSEGDSLAPVNF